MACSCDLIFHNFQRQADPDTGKHAAGIEEERDAMTSIDLHQKPMGSIPTSARLPLRAFHTPGQHLSWWPWLLDRLSFPQLKASLSNVHASDLDR
jgi:hypothetical protein